MLDKINIELNYNNINTESLQEESKKYLRDNEGSKSDNSLSPFDKEFYDLSEYNIVEPEEDLDFTI